MITVIAILFAVAAMVLGAISLGGNGAFGLSPTQCTGLALIFLGIACVLLAIAPRISA